VEELAAVAVEAAEGDGKDMYRKNLKNEYYTRKAKQENYPARSVYKLEEIDKKFSLIKKGDRVLDLGCAPGSWLLYIAKKAATVVGIDVQDLEIEIPENAEFIKADVIDFNVSGKYNVVVSDLAPSTSGIHWADVEKSLEFGERALEIAKKVLVDGGNFLCKVFEGEGINDFFKKIEQNFKLAKRYKPKASRKESREIYIIGKGFRHE